MKPKNFKISLSNFTFVQYFDFLTKRAKNFDFYLNFKFYHIFLGYFRYVHEDTQRVWLEHKRENEELSWNDYVKQSFGIRPKIFLCFISIYKLIFQIYQSIFLFQNIFLFSYFFFIFYFFYFYYFLFFSISFLFFFSFVFFIFMPFHFNFFCYSDSEFPKVKN